MMLVFVLGAGGCGSTFVAETLARHRDVGFVSNLDDNLRHLDLLGRWNNCLLRRSAPRDPRLSVRLPRRLLESERLRLRPSEGWKLLDRQVAHVFSGSCRDLVAEDCSPWVSARLQAFFERRIAAQRRPVFIHHVTGWPRVGFLRVAFPEARFVHVVRDGRAVANAWMQSGCLDAHRGPGAWGLGPLPEAHQRLWEESGRSLTVLSGLAWRILIEASEAARFTVPAPHWLEVRYEELLDRPRHHVERLLEFVGLRWDADFARQFARVRCASIGAEAFRTDLGVDGVAALERAIGVTLRAYGYRTGSTPVGMPGQVSVLGRRSPR
jgi:hypothetical protein